MKRVPILFFCVLLLFSCAPAPQVSRLEVVTVYATSAAQPWLNELYACASKSGVVLNVNADTPDIYLRLGEPDIVFTPAYPIDEEEILVVTHRESPIQNLSLEEVRALFTKGDASTQVWVYSPEADVQRVFDQFVMKGRGVASSAKLAVNPQNMSDVLNSNSNAVGILPRHWRVGNEREVFSAGVVTVLAITRRDPQKLVLDLVTCLQDK